MISESLYKMQRVGRGLRENRQAPVIIDYMHLYHRMKHEVESGKRDPKGYSLDELTHDEAEKMMDGKIGYIAWEQVEPILTKRQIANLMGVEYEPNLNMSTMSKTIRGILNVKIEQEISQIRSH